MNEELVKLLTWYAPIRTHYHKNIGKFGRYLQEFIEPELWDELIVFFMTIYIISIHAEGAVRELHP